MSAIQGLISQHLPVTGLNFVLGAQFCEVLGGIEIFG
jgi:hypothetical protein